MTKFTNPLDNIKIASPCSQDWNAMTGVGRKRYCGECKLNVYNLSGMTRDEAENLLMNSEGRLCVRFYRRSDGTVLTKDCPVGWAAIKRRVSKMAAAFASLIFGVIGGLGFQTALTDAKAKENRRSLPVIHNTPLMGDVAYDDSYATMGNIAMPTPKPTPKKNDKVELMGKVYAPKN